MTPALQLRKLKLSYQLAGAEVPVLRSVDLTVARGESVAIVGPSGSGKTSLLLVLAGLEAPAGGEIEIEGQVLGRLGRDARADWRREHLGMVFQSFHLLPGLTALENVALPLQMLGRADAWTEARQWLERVGLAARLDHRPSSLSGGEQQRVAIARALVHKPRLVLADEPTGNLDQATGAHVEDLLFGLNREAGSTLVLVTHDPELAARCDRVMRLQDGRLVEQTAAAVAA